MKSQISGPRPVEQGAITHHHHNIPKRTITKEKRGQYKSIVIAVQESTAPQLVQTNMDLYGMNLRSCMGVQHIEIAHDSARGHVSLGDAASRQAERRVSRRKNKSRWDSIPESSKASHSLPCLPSRKQSPDSPKKVRRSTRVISPVSDSPLLLLYLAKAG